MKEKYIKTEAERNVQRDTSKSRRVRDLAMIEMAEYLKKHSLDPNLDWTRDPVHGPRLTHWMKIIRVYGEKSKALEIRERVLKKPSKDILMPKDKRKSPVDRYACIYDYPTLDNGEPLTPNQKKTYRQKLRRLLEARVSKDRAEKMALTFLKERYNGHTSGN